MTQGSNSNADATARIDGNGEAWFANTVAVGGTYTTDYSGANIVISGSGAATFNNGAIFNSAVKVRQDSNGATALAVTQGGTANSNATFRVNGNGSAEFAGGIDTGNEFNNGTQIDSNGGIAVQRQGASDIAFTVLEKKDTKVTILGSGAAEFAGDLSIGNVAGGEGTVIANNQIYTANLNVNNPTTDNDISIIRAGNGNNSNNKFKFVATGTRVGIGTNVSFNANDAEIKLNTDGSAEFDNVVKSSIAFEAYRTTSNINNSLFIGYSNVGSTKKRQFVISTSGSGTFEGALFQNGSTPVLAADSAVLY